MWMRVSASCSAVCLRFYTCPVLWKHVLAKCIKTALFSLCYRILWLYFTSTDANIIQFLRSNTAFHIHELVGDVFFSRRSSIGWMENKFHLGLFLNKGWVICMWLHNHVDRKKRVCSKFNLLNLFLGMVLTC